MDKSVLKLKEYLPSRIADAVCSIENSEHVQEIRLRVRKPVSVTFENSNLFLLPDGKLSKFSTNSLRVSETDLEKTFLAICENSVYAHENEIKQGYVAMRGGGRAGICGTAVYSEQGLLEGFTDISSINMRIPREKIGCTDGIKDLISKGIIIVSAPNLGKTTMLKDAVRQASESGIRVAVIDERGELSGNAANDLGPFTDVITGIEKAKGVEIAIRTLSPQLIAFDEIGTREEADKLVFSANSGVPVLTSIHAGGMEELESKQIYQTIAKSGAIRYAVILDGLCRVGKVVEF